jgi:ATP-dependent helicase/nuclease subunit A
MSDFISIPDAEARLRALDPEKSFIVQAPAGSGKTGLLIQRYLRLLAHVDNPEEIVAITFTRKAAAEMRERILKALQSADAKSSPLFRDRSAFDQLTHELATDALRRDRLSAWRILENPARLRIQTIDSLCASLTQQMPILSHFGAQPVTTEDASDLYVRAARSTIELLNENVVIADDLERLFEHLDNDAELIVNLLVEMLARRDHWLRHIHGKTREELEASLRVLRSNAVEDVSSAFPEALENELIALLRYAAANLAVSDVDSAIAQCVDLDTLPDTVEEWCGVSELLLTQDSDWRKQVNKKQGFPPGMTATEKESAQLWKARMAAFIQALADNDTVRQALIAMRRLPPPAYSDAQWEMLGVIIRLLPHAVAELKVIFDAVRQVDFTEVAQRALQALGEAEMPTDLALHLDYRIRHLLIDEFQDTSISQFQLIEKLIGGWEMHDGRSLFAVGDPMQSIYRFREAEVGLFLQARHFGIGNIKPEPVTLSSNFRSQRGIVNWVNHTFQQIMPVVEDSAVGAVAYKPSFAVHDEQAERAVTLHPVFENNRVLEARQVIEVIRQVRNNRPDDSIAILVRNRSHLSEIVALLQAENIHFRAVDIDALNQKPVIQDLMMLTRALLNLADRIAWLSVLRAPWCGLKLADLQALVSPWLVSDKDNNRGKSSTIWSLMNDESYSSYVSEDGLKRLQRIRSVFSQCIQNRFRMPLRSTVETVWQILGGPGCMEKNSILIVANKRSDAQIFFEYLEKHERAGTIANWNVFHNGLARLFAPADLQADDRLQIMTIHKSKGLEFDTVLMPGLGYNPRNRSRQLLQWMELPRNENDVNSESMVAVHRQADLFLAPIQQAGDVTDKINQWIALVEQDKEDFESDRLLYVAATRAKKFLHLFGHVNTSGTSEGMKIRPPRAGSLLSRLWPVIEKDFVIGLGENLCKIEQSYSINNTEIKFDQSIVRLVSNWRVPAAPQSVIWQFAVTESTVQEEIEFSWASEIARHIGSIVHRTLQQMAEDRLHRWDSRRIHSMRKIFELGLLNNGLSVERKILEQAVDRIMVALTNTLADERGKWLLSEKKDAQNEFRLTRVMKHGTVNYVIDRTFCDSDNVRWIIDYKTSSHEGADVALFLNRELDRYRNQLNNYAQAFHQIDRRRIFLGLYFPLLNGWREWEFK